MTILPPEYQITILDLSLQNNGVQASLLPFLLKKNIQVSSENDISVALILFDEQTDETHFSEQLSYYTSKNIRTIGLNISKNYIPFYKSWNRLCMGLSELIFFDNAASVAETIFQRIIRWKIIDKIADSDIVQKKIIGSCPAIRTVIRQCIEMAAFSKAPVLIQGESGTGKELFARLIHDLDRRPEKKNLVLLDCSTIVPELSGSEFFGHEKGAFTNAIASRDGAFALADRGTLFLDEVGELPLNMQSDLLRVIQEGTFKRVGSNLWKHSRFRLISATNRQLSQEIQAMNFRQDLYYRISTCVIHLPPLKERKTDIPELAKFFLKQVLKKERVPEISKPVLQYLMTRAYPGNIRELKQVMTRIAYKHVGEGSISLGDIPIMDREQINISKNTWQENGWVDSIRDALINGIGIKEIKRLAGNAAMDIAIQEANGNLQEAAQKLDVSDRTLQTYQASKKE